MFIPSRNSLCTPPHHPDSQWLPRRCDIKPQRVILFLINPGQCPRTQSDTSNSGYHAESRPDSFPFLHQTLLHHQPGQGHWGASFPRKDRQMGESKLTSPHVDHYLTFIYAVQPWNTRFRPLHEGSPWTLPKHIFITTYRATASRNTSTALHTRIDE